MPRWLTRVGIVVGLAMLSGAGLVVTPLVWPGDPDDSIRTVAGRQVGEATGYVVSLDPENGVLKVSSSILGLRPVTFAIDANTPIIVGNKQGGLGDLAADVPVRVAYERDGQRRRARFVEVVLAESDTGVGVSSDAVSSPVGAASAPERLEPPRRLDPEPSAPEPSAPVNLVPKRPPLVPASAPNAPVATGLPKRVERRQAAAPARPLIDDEKAMEAAAARRGSAASTPPTSTDDAGRADGTAAIDWLIRSRDR